MTKKHKFALVVVAIFTLVLLLSLYFIKKNKSQTSSSDCELENSTVCRVDLSSVSTAEETKTQIGSFGTPQTIEQNVYKNDALGFELTMSSVWQGAKVTEVIPNPPAEGKVEFQIPTTDKAIGKDLAIPLTIYVYKSENVPDPATNPLLTKIISSGNLVYEYKPWDNVPSDLGQFTEKEISQVITTFKLLGK